jgi:predicted secreted protein
MAKFWAQGTTVTISPGATPIAIGGLDGVTTPEENRGSVDLTDHDSGGWTEFIAGLRNTGTMSLEGKYDPEDAGQTALRDNFEADSPDATVTFVITLPDGAASTSPVTFTFSGFVTVPPTVDLPGAEDEPARFSSTVQATHDGGATPAIVIDLGS